MIFGVTSGVLAGTTGVAVVPPGVLESTANKLVPGMRVILLVGGSNRSLVASTRELVAMGRDRSIVDASNSIELVRNAVVGVGVVLAAVVDNALSIVADPSTGLLATVPSASAVVEVWSVSTLVTSIGLLVISTGVVTSITILVFSPEMLVTSVCVTSAGALVTAIAVISAGVLVTVIDVTSAGALVTVIAVTSAGVPVTVIGVTSAVVLVTSAGMLEAGLSSAVTTDVSNVRSTSYCFYSALLQYTTCDCVLVLNVYTTCDLCPCTKRIYHM